MIAVVLFAQTCCCTQKNNLQVLRQPATLDIPEEKPPTVRDHVKNAAIGVAKLAGIAVILPAILLAKFHFDSQEEQAEERQKQNSFPNDLWRQGYGYNNPNNARILEGKPPQNFDGSVSK
jgi:hypothetical protein